MRIAPQILAASVLAYGTLSRAQQITAAGATFPAPIYQKWFGEYHKLHPEVQINYQSIGSGAGIQQLTAGTVDFGASDMPMTDGQISRVKIRPLHFPTVMGAVVPTYNVPGAPPDLKFSGDTLAGIFLGTVDKWNHKTLVADNPGVRLPGEDIVVVHRSDGSGTSFVWTDYLSKVSPEWKKRVGSNTSVRWPVGLGGKGNEGVAGTVKQIPNSIGYVELIYAIQNKMAYGSVKNAAGAFIRPTMQSVSLAAASAVKDMPADFRMSVTNTAGKGAYPIASFTWLLIPSRFPDNKKGQAVTGFLKWMLTHGQGSAPSLGYASLPEELIAKEMAQISDVR